MNTTPKHKITPVQETNYGVYVWLTDDNQIIANENREYLSIQAKEHDLTAIGALRKAVRHYGIEGGKPFFLPGRRKINQEEFEEQKARLDAGLTPDPYDVGALKDDLRAARDFS